MKFYFPDSQDLVSPTYDFVNDEYSPFRVRQRDDRYAHEVLETPPYDGLLVSKAVVDGSVRGTGRYSMPQRQRIYRMGVRDFFRLPESTVTMGDCGSFTYADEPEPPYSVAEVLDFYEECGFDAGVSVDHVILGYSKLGKASDDWIRRQQTTLECAQAYLDEGLSRKTSVEPVGAAQGWDPESYADSVAELQKMGYLRIALGGMIALKTPDILDCLAAIDDVRHKNVSLHLLGISRIESFDAFKSHGVTSFDSTSVFRQAFMDDRDNYHTVSSTFAAIRVPQVEGNVSVKRAILSGRLRQSEAKAAEKDALRALREYDAGRVTAAVALDSVLAYERLVIGPKRKTYAEHYERTLECAPWRECSCGLCEYHGIEIAVFRGTERNKRRGFHNLATLRAKIARKLEGVGR
ncbi:tRNA-guanine transglycosylase DpdA [Gordonia bronchialis]|uniref:tRNA-guanine transglycosylase DpdA n=1 Tax=Gordonia bronchialis TaxID=2054 RepID=UPI00226F9042|nr:tRNA-guanine transglycosylase DpdA [Gordonia bronchialis]